MAPCTLPCRGLFLALRRAVLRGCVLLGCGLLGMGPGAGHTVLSADDATPAHVDEELPPEAWDEPEAPVPPPSPPSLWPDPEAIVREWIVDTLFIDARTGAPIPGVEVCLYPEVPHPEASFGVPAGTCVSDAAGRARLRRDALAAEVIDVYGGPHIAIARARGYAIDGAQQHSWIGEWPLRPGQHVALTVVDELERPVEGALVSWVLGCGHTPDALQARTDAQGQVRFDDVDPSEEVDPDVVVLKEGFELEIVTNVLEERFPIRLRRGRDVAGRVLTHEGAPLAGAAVGLRGHRHRGPWTRTDVTGAFRLLGVPEDARGTTLAVERREYPIDTPDPPYDLLLPVPDRRTPFLLRLPAPGGSRKVEAPSDGVSDPEQMVEAPIPHAVELGWEGPGDAFGSGGPELVVGVVAVRRSDGATLRLDLGPQGRGTLPLLPGTHDLWIRVWQAELVNEPWRVRGQDATDFVPPCAQVRTDVEVGFRPPYDLRFVMPRPRSVVLERTPDDGWVGGVALLAPGRAPAPLELEERLTLLLPPIGDFALELSDDWSALRIPLVLEGEARVSLPPRVRPPTLTLLAPDGSPLLEPQGSIVVGEHVGDLRDALEPREPMRPRADLVDPRDPRLLVPGARLRVRSWRALPRDDAKVLEAPFEAVLEGAGPWTLRAPAGELLVHLGRELDVTPPEQSIQLDGGPVERVRGELVRVVGLPPGPHEVVVRAAGHRARRLRFTLAEGQAERWDAHLRAR